MWNGVISRNKKQMGLVVFVLLLVFSTSVTAQNKDQLDSALAPFWQSNLMYNESVLMISRNGALPTARLLFTPDKILSVRNAGLNIEYTKGKDWDFIDGQLRLLNESGCVFLTDHQLYPDSSSINTFPRKGGGYLLFSE